MTQPQITILGACERDLDLLLVEEFASSAAFVKWFASRCGLADDATLVEVGHSITSSNGETDIELTVTAGGKRHKVLIENKVDAAFQDRQPQRYRERAASCVRDGTVASATAVLVAPRAYLASTPGAAVFDARVALEDVRDWFSSSPDLGSRRDYKVVLLTRTIERGASGWTLVPNTAVTSFWREYWRVACEVAPELEMAPPKAKPAGSGFPWFRPAGMPNPTEIVHKLPHGNVDLTLYRMGDQVASLLAKYGAVLEPGMAIAKAGNSAVFRLRVPVIDAALPFAECEPAARQGLAAAATLLRWYRRHYMA